MGTNLAGLRHPARKLRSPRCRFCWLLSTLDSRQWDADPLSVLLSRKKGGHQKVGGASEMRTPQYAARVNTGFIFSTTEGLLP